MWLTGEDLLSYHGWSKINLYDFDGVLASPFEEALFTLGPTKYDAQFIRKVTDNLALDLSLESPQSQRYICMQALMYDLVDRIKPGPISVEKGVPFYIVTARCDWFAVARMREFVENNLGLIPVKTLHLDHLRKGEAIRMILDRHPDYEFSFWDDNMNHIESALSLNSDRLNVKYVDNDMRPFYREASTYYQDRLLAAVL